jgi:hypothetical protein
MHGPPTFSAVGLGRHAVAKSAKSRGFQFGRQKMMSDAEVTVGKTRRAGGRHSGLMLGMPALGDLASRCIWPCVWPGLSAWRPARQSLDRANRE